MSLVVPSILDLCRLHLHGPGTLSIKLDQSRSFRSRNRARMLTDFDRLPIDPMKIARH
jgi:hypothetical protein